MQNIEEIDEHAAEYLDIEEHADADEEETAGTPLEEWPDEDCSALGEESLPHALTHENARDPFFGSRAMDESPNEDTDVDFEHLYNYM